MLSEQNKFIISSAHLAMDAEIIVTESPCLISSFKIAGYIGNLIKIY